MIGDRGVIQRIHNLHKASTRDTKTEMVNQNSMSTHFVTIFRSDLSSAVQLTSRWS
jgi:hypothetical protein